MRERRFRVMDFRWGDMSVPASVLPPTPPPDRPRSSFGEKIARLVELRYLIREEASDLIQVQTWRREQDELLLGVLSGGLSGDLPEGVRVHFAPSENNPEATLHITVIEHGQILPFYLSDQWPGRTPSQQGVVNKARAVISSRG